MYNFSNDAHVGFAPFIVLDLSPSCPVCVGPLSLQSSVYNSSFVFKELYPVIDPNNLNHNHHSCDYFNDFNFNAALNCDNRSTFSFMHVNIRSLPKNFDQMRNYLHTLHSDFSVMGLSETWLKNSDMPFNIYSIPGYQLETNNRTGRVGGGVALYISSDLHYKVRLDLSHSSDSFESIFIEV